MPQPIQSADERSQPACSQEDNDGGDRENDLNQRSAEKVHESPENTEDSVPTFVDKEVNGIDDPDDEGHVMTAMRSLVIGREVPGEINENQENDDVEGNEGSFHERVRCYGYVRILEEAVRM